MSRIYLVQDQALLRDGLRTLLQQARHLVVGEAEDPCTALHEVLQLGPDVLLLDLDLGSRSGLELLSELHRRRVPAGCIVLTASREPGQVAEALRLGARGYVLKHSPFAVLLEAIDAVSQGWHYLADATADLAIEVLAGTDEPDRLSAREREIAVLVARGCSSAAIGQQLGLSPKTVDTYRSRLMKKLGLADAAAVVRWAVRQGLVDGNE